MYNPRRPLSIPKKKHRAHRRPPRRPLSVYARGRVHFLKRDRCTLTRGVVVYIDYQVLLFLLLIIKFYIRFFVNYQILRFFLLIIKSVLILFILSL